jgi:small subunit ribosomal protein S16
MGRKNRPFYRIGAYDNRTRREGVPVEQLGTYDPLVDDATKQVVLKADRVRYWLSMGAKPSETVASMIKKAGIEVPVTKPKKKPKKAKKG